MNKIDIERSVFIINESGLFDEDYYKTEYFLNNEENINYVRHYVEVGANDVDFCLRVQEQGYHNIFTPYAEAYHHESISRGYEDTIEKQKRFEKEVDYIKERHNKILENGDSFYNLNLTLNGEDFSLKC